MESELTQYGFRWGVAEVTRQAELPGERVVIGVTTPRAQVDVIVSRTGRVRVFTGTKEWKPEP